MKNASKEQAMETTELEEKNNDAPVTVKYEPEEADEGEEEIGSSFYSHFWSQFADNRKQQANQHHEEITVEVEPLSCLLQGGPRQPLGKGKMKNAEPGTSKGVLRRPKKRDSRRDLISRVFNPAWTEQFLFIQGKHRKPVCLICGSTIAVVKKFNLERHHKLNHVGFEIDYPSGSSLRSDFIGSRLNTMSLQPNFFVEKIKETEAMLSASYEIALCLAKWGTPYNDAEMVKECISIYAQNCLSLKAVSVVDKLVLEPSVVMNRMIEMSNDVKEQFKNFTAPSKDFSLAFDASCKVMDRRYLSVYLRSVDSDFQIEEELIGIQPISNSATARDIFEMVKSCVQGVSKEKQKINWSGLENICTDGSQLMRLVMPIMDDFLGRKVQNYDCIIPLQECANQLNFSHVVDPLLCFAKHIASQPPNEPLFQALFFPSFKEIDLCLPECDITWLLKDRTLERLWSIKEEITQHLYNLEPLNFDKNQWMFDFAFLIDVMALINDLNTHIQAEGNLFPTLVNSVSSLVSKLRLFEAQFQCNKIEHFQHLKELEMSDQSSNIPLYSEAISSLRSAFLERFPSTEGDKDSIALFANPFAISDTDVQRYDSSLQMEILELKTNCYYQSKFKELCSERPDLISFWKVIPKKDFPKLNKLATKISCRFGSTFVVEKSFSALRKLVNKNATVLSDANLQSLVLLASTNKNPRLKNIIKKKKNKGTCG